MKADELKLIVKDKYGAIAKQENEKSTGGCCGSSGCCDTIDYTVFSDDYSGLDGYIADADMGLGCGLPTQYAGIKKGDHVLDLGSGAGNDCFVARTLTGAEGHITGIDFTDEMLEKARLNLSKTGFKNISFVKGDIEDMPLPDGSFDVVISNCVLNLIPDKRKAFSEIYRVLKPGGHFCISDVVLNGELPLILQEAAELYAGCVSGAVQKEEYLNIIREQGFTALELNKEKEIVLPDSLLLNYLSPDELQAFKKQKAGIFSITINGKRK